MIRKINRMTQDERLRPTEAAKMKCAKRFFSASRYRGLRPAYAEELEQVRR